MLKENSHRHYHHHHHIHLDITAEQDEYLHVTLTDEEGTHSEGSSQNEEQNTNLHEEGKQEIDKKNTKKQRIVGLLRSFFCPSEKVSGWGLFEKWLTLWVLLCMGVGLLLGHFLPQVVQWLDSLSIFIHGAPVISIPIAICLFFMMFPIMVKIDYGTILKSLKNFRPILITLIINWVINPFTMYGIALLFLGVVFLPFIGHNSCDALQVPLGDIGIGETVGFGRVGCIDPNFLSTCTYDRVTFEGVTSCDNISQQRVLVLDLWRSYFAGCILLGIAPCTAMVIVWSYLAKGNQGHTLAMVAINTLLMLPLYGAYSMLLLGLSVFPLPWETLLLSLSVYIALPLVCGFILRIILIKVFSTKLFERFCKILTPITILALLFTLIVLFALKSDLIIQNPLTIIWIAIPLTIQFILTFFIGYCASWIFRISYEDAAPTAMIGASNHFEVAIATAAVLYGISSGAALATVVGVIIEVPIMILLVKFCILTKRIFPVKKEKTKPKPLEQIIDSSSEEQDHHISAVF